MAKEIKTVLIDEDYWKLTNYKAWEQPEFTGIVEATTTDTYTVIFTAYSDMTIVEKMYIDGELLDEPVKQYTFNTLGEHTIKVIFTNDASLEEFLNSGRIVHILDIKTDKFNSLFYGAKLLKTVNLDNLVKPTESVDFSYVFYFCHELEKVDLSPLKGLKVFNLSRLFSHCEKLKEIDLSPLCFVGDEIEMTQCFSTCYKLQKVKMMGDVSKVKDVKEMFKRAGQDVENPKFYYDARYDYSKIIAELPEHWTAIPVYE